MQNLQTDSSMILIERLFQQMSQQWQQERHEIRQDLMFICQYMNILTERQDQHWQQIHYHHDQVMSEMRHHFQALHSFLTSQANSQEDTANTFPLQQNQQLKQFYTVPVVQKGNELIHNKQFESNGHQANDSEQKVLSLSSQDITTSNDVTVGFKASPSETLSDKQSQGMSEYKGNGQDTQSFLKRSLASRWPDRQTFEQISKQQNGQDETLGINNRPQKVNELNVQFVDITKLDNEPHREPNNNFEINESHYGGSGLDICRSEEKVKMDSVDGQRKHIRHADKHIEQTRHIDEQNSKIRYDVEENVQKRQLDEEKLTRHANEQKVQERQIDEQKVQTRHVNRQKVQERQTDEQKVQTQYANEQKVQERQMDEQKVQTRHVNGQKVQERYIDEEKVQTRHVNEQKVQERYIDEEKVQTRHVNEQKVQKRLVDTQNEKNQEESEWNCRSQLLTQPENVLGNNTNGSEEQDNFMDVKPSVKKYADAVTAGYTSDNMKMKSSSEQVYNNSLLFTGSPDLLKTQGSFEGTGLYAESISKLYNTQPPMNGQTYYKNVAKKNYKSETLDSKVFPKNSYKVSSTDTKENRKKAQSKFH